MAEYKGYLAPYVAAIRDMDAGGFTTKQIAQCLFDAGVRSPNEPTASPFDGSPIQRIDHVRTFNGLIRHMLGKNRPTKVKQVEKRVARLEKELSLAKAELSGLAS
jgi:hypothetical protein